MANPRTLPTRLLVIFLVVMLLVGASGVVVLLWFSKSSDTRDADMRGALENLVLAERLRADIERTLASARGYLLAGDPVSLERALHAESDANRDLHDIGVRIEHDGTTYLNQLAIALDSYNQALKRLLDDKTRGDALDQISKHFELEVLPRRETLDAAIDAFITHREERLSEIVDANRRSGRATLGAGLAVVLGSVIAAGIISWRTATRLAAAYDKLEASERTAHLAVSAREQLLATVAHDLRNPLNAISIRATLIQKCKDLDKAHEQAAGIANVSTRMDSLIKSLLDAASLEAGRLKLHKTRCDVGEMMRETTTLFASLAEPKSIALESTPPPAPIEVWADRNRVLQVLSNLVGNAIKFTPEGGTVRLSAERTDGRVRFAVSDTGRGIAAEHVPRLFDRFWQAEVGGQQGNGLGLFIAKGIVDAHAGRIWVESEIGHGATFYFTLPYQDRPAPLVTQSLPNPGSHKSTLPPGAA